MSHDFLISAQRLAALSFCLFPVYSVNGEGHCACNKGSECTSPGKHPVLSGWQVAATTDLDKIRKWAKKHPNANVGIATGKASGITVLDVDGKAGRASIQDWEEKHGSLPETVMVQTGSGGLHYYFLYNPFVRNAVGFLKGLDIRTDGGFVVAPDSLHTSGGSYAFQKSPEETPLAKMPAFVINDINEKKEVKKAKKDTELFEEGERNSGLFSLGIGLWHRGRTPDEVLDFLETQNEARCKPTLPDAEIKSILKSITKYEPEFPAHDSEGRRNIIVGQEQLRELTRLVGRALIERNRKNETIYRNQSTLIQLYRAGNEVISRAMNTDLMLAELVENNNWLKETRQGFVPSDPPEKMTKLLFNGIDLSGFQNLKGIIHWPIFTKSGQFLMDNGYHPAVERIISVPPGFEVNVPTTPSQQDVEDAKKLIFDDLLTDFPFADDASKANTLAALLQPICGDIIQPPCPLHFFQAPMAGTGKSLLVKVICILLFGKEPPTLTLGENDAETRKRLSSQLFSLACSVFLDNMPPKVNSHSLAAALTTGVWSDRILGVSNIKNVEVNALWMGTGNNVSFSNELARRLVPIDLEPRDGSPSMRSNFKHSNLLEWVQENRPALIRALCILIRHWFVSKQPKGKQVFGSYESYTQVIGGILDAAGVQGFLANRTEEFLNQDDDSFFWIHVVDAWYKQFGEEPIGVGCLLYGVLDADFLDEFLPATDRNTSLGMKIRQVRNRVFNGLKILWVGRGPQGQALYRLQPISSKYTPPKTFVEASKSQDEEVY